MAHIRIEHEYYRTPEFIDYANKKKRLVYEFILQSVIRDSTEAKDFRYGGHYIYKNFFLAGKLVGRYSQDNIAKYLNTQQSHISTYIKELEKDGLIKILKPFPSVCYYQVGIWEGELNSNTYKEILWFDVIFTALAKVAKDKRRGTEKEGVSSLERMLQILDPDSEDYEKYKDLL